jgi:two-component system, NarL family, nitrate/nitrite response regulator NarL
MQLHANLLIVADHPLYIEGFESMLARRAPTLRCTAARTPSQAIERLRAADSLALVIADYQLAGPTNGLSLLQQIGARRPALPRLLMTNGDDSGLSVQARRAGLAGCVSKTMEPADWVQALDVILSGGYCFAAPAPVGSTLNERQITVLQLASVGLGTRQIAHKLHLTERTVKYHLSESFRRLATSTRTEAVAKAAALGLISLSVRQSLSA